MTRAAWAVSTRWAGFAVATERMRAMRLSVVGGAERDRRAAALRSPGGPGAGGAGLVTAHVRCRPPGGLAHARFGAGDKLRVFDVWESRAAFEQFGRTLPPILAQVGIEPGGRR